LIPSVPPSLPLPPSTTHRLSDFSSLARSSVLEGDSSGVDDAIEVALAVERLVGFWREAETDRKEGDAAVLRTSSGELQFQWSSSGRKIGGRKYLLLARNQCAESVSSMAFTYSLFAERLPFPRANCRQTALGEQASASGVPSSTSRL
jgi:hypothetical protein